MKQIMLSSIALLAIGILSWYSLPYFYRYSAKCTEQEALVYLQHEIMSFQSLNFPPSSELVASLVSYKDELAALYEARNATGKGTALDFEDSRKRDALIAVNKKILQGYMHDLQRYTKLGMGTTTSVVQFCYDKVVRLTIALAELEKHRNGGLSHDEYVKKMGRMTEIIKQSIVHSKKTLRSYLYAGLQEDNPNVQAERLHVTRKVSQLIELEKILYL